MLISRLVRSSVCTIALLLPTVLFASERNSEKAISFTGYVQGSVSGSPNGQPPTSISVVGNDTGLSGELGPFKISYRFTIQPGPGPSGPSTAAGSAEWVIGNGDIIYTNFAAAAKSTDVPSIVRVVEFYEITGGTGRFSNAQGQITVKRLAGIGPSPQQVFGHVEGIIEFASSDGEHR